MICRTVIKRTYFTLLDTDIDLNNLVTQDSVGLKLSSLMSMRYATNWITYTDSEVIPGEDAQEALPDIAKLQQWRHRFNYIYETTRERYEKIIELYDSQKQNLLNSIGSTTTNVFNDTPGNLNTGDTDDYTSTYSKTKTEVEPGEIINRLNNIDNKLTDIYARWVREFDGLFGESLI